MDIIKQFITFFFLLCVVIIHYWYVTLPLVILAILVYWRVKKPWVRKILRVIFAFLILSVLSGIIVILFEEGASSI